MQDAEKAGAAAKSAAARIKVFMVYPSSGGVILEGGKMKSKVSKKAATKANGTLKKGYRYAKGGRIVKAKK